jgi:hypothetical protein
MSWVLALLACTAEPLPGQTEPIDSAVVAPDDDTGEFNPDDDTGEVVDTGDPDSDTDPPEPDADEDLDARRLAVLIDAASSELRGQDGSCPTPNQTLRPARGEHGYAETALALFALSHLGEPEGNDNLANKLLRYQVLCEWPATQASDINGQYSKAWSHRRRPLALRVYALFKGRLDSDVRAEFEKRLDWLLTNHMTGSSENIRFTNNSSRCAAGPHSTATRTTASGWSTRSRSG